MEIINYKVRLHNESDFGNHPLDFQHKCSFREQIIDIGEGTKYGDGEIISG
jgi:hypothetical protein